MTVLYIVVAYEFPTNQCLGIVASATSLEQANMIIKAFAFVALSYRRSIMYVIRDLSSASLYGPECSVNLLQDWQLDMC
jgi:hypothetical protein